MTAAATICRGWQAIGEAHVRRDEQCRRRFTLRPHARRTRGYLVKGVEQEDIARAIRSVAAGEAIFGPGDARRVLAYLHHPPARPDLALPGAFPTGETRCSTCSRLASTTPRSLTRLGIATKTVANNAVGDLREAAGGRSRRGYRARTGRRARSRLTADRRTSGPTRFAVYAQGWPDLRSGSRRGHPA